MKLITVLLVLSFAGYKEIQAATAKDLSYQELRDLPMNCQHSEQQLVVLKNLQKLKKFNPNPDQLSEYDRSYNGLLKAKIWWYAYRCGKS